MLLQSTLPWQTLLWFHYVCYQFPGFKFTLSLENIACQFTPQHLLITNHQSTPRDWLLLGRAFCVVCLYQWRAQSRLMEVKGACVDNYWRSNCVCVCLFLRDRCVRREKKITVHAFLNLHTFLNWNCNSNKVFSFRQNDLVFKFANSNTHISNKHSSLWLPCFHWQSFYHIVKITGLFGLKSICLSCKCH